METKINQDISLNILHGNASPEMTSEPTCRAGAMISVLRSHILYIDALVQ